jgi:hypothetical protein
MEHADELIDLRVNDRLANERQRAVPDGVGFMQPLWYHACEAACVSIRPHTSAYVSIRRECWLHAAALVSRLRGRMRQHTSAYVSIRPHTSAYVENVGVMQPLWYHVCEAACVSIRQHTSAYVSIRRECWRHASLWYHACET